VSAPLGSKCSCTAKDRTDPWNASTRERQILRRGLRECLCACDHLYQGQRRLTMLERNSGDLVIVQGGSEQSAGSLPSGAVKVPGISHQCRRSAHAYALVRRARPGRAKTDHPPARKAPVVDILPERRYRSTPPKPARSSARFDILQLSGPAMGTPLLAQRLLSYLLPQVKAREHHRRHLLSRDPRPQTHRTNAAFPYGRITRILFRKN